MEEGVLLGKDGSLLAGWWYSGPDMESATHEEMAVLSSQLNAAFAAFGNGWVLQADAIRMPATRYPEEGAFPDPTSRLIDEERRAHYTSGEGTYESVYALTLAHLPPPDAQARVADLFLDGKETRRGGWETVLAGFRRSCAQVEDALSDRLSLQRMGSEALLAYLVRCATGSRQPVAVPPVPVDLDFLVGAEDLAGGFEPRVGKRHVRCVAVTGYPVSSFPGILDVLNRIPVEYRWSSRFIPLHPETAVARLRTLRRNWWQKRQGLTGMIKQALQQGGQTFADRDAMRMAEDADDCVAEATSGAVRFGYYTNVIVLMDEDPGAAEAAAREILRELQHRGFVGRVETLNALEAFLGSLPGHGYRNLRRPLVHTLNLADLLPTTTVYPGLETNPCPYYPPGSPPLLYANTSGCTPFRFHLHVSDVGHALVVGPTGSGKSTLVGLLMAQFRRYPAATVFAFDKGYSSLLLSRAAGGDHYDVAGDTSGELSFYPLAGVAEPGERLWAEEWLATLLQLQGVDLGPAHQKAIHVALERLAHSESRTLTDFVNTVQSREIRDGLRHYTLEGALGALLDADRDGLRDGDFEVFEMERLMGMGDKNAVPVLLYLFHRIEERLRGQPALLVLEEAWLLLDHPLFRDKIEEWLRVLRKRNCAVVFVTQNLSDVYNSPQCDLLLESCPTKIFLPNPEAQTPQSRSLYRRAGLNERQVEMIASAIPKRHYYYVSPLGRRMLDLALGPVALSFLGIPGSEELARARGLMERCGPRWPAEWLRHRGLEDWAQAWHAWQEKGRRDA